MGDGEGTGAAAGTLEAAMAAFEASPNARRAFVAPMFDGAAAAAKDGRPGLLSGVPVAVKDIFDMEGCVTRNGRQPTLDVPAATEDAAVVAAIKAAGGVVVGRTHQTEMAFSATGYNPHYPQPFSPFGEGLMPGGSSSGSAVAVAEGAASVALGTDTGGSIRVPAAWCGVVGFKPTSGYVPLDGVLPLAPSLDTCGFFARRTVDCALLLSICAPALDGAGAPSPTPRDVWDGAGWAVPPARLLRLACIEGALTSEMDAPTEESYRGALDVLRAEGATIEPLELPFFDELMEAMRVIFYVEGAHSNLAIGKDPAKLAEVDETVRLRIVDGSAMPATQYVTAVQTRARLQRRMAELTAHYDAVVLPTVPVAPPSVAACEADAAAMASAARNSSRNTRLCNALNRPAISLPCHASGSPLPAGLTLMGSPGRDGFLLAAAASAESCLLRAGVGGSAG